MRSKFVGLMIVLTLALGFSGVGLAQSRHRNNKSSEVGGDKTIEKQSAWEEGVMGEDSAKKSDLRKIAAAQKLADHARMNPPPIEAPKVKDPSKEGVRAKQEASIGLPIASDEAAKNVKNKKNTKSTTKGAAENGTGGGKKVALPSSSANDELGSLVASSLAEDKAAQSGATRSGLAGDVSSAGSSTNESGTSRSKGRTRHQARGKTRAKSGGAPVGGDAPGALDQLFATGK